MERCYPATTDWSCYPGYNVDPEQATPPYSEIDPTVKARAEMLAWLSLGARTGQSVGTCPVTVRPCAASCGPRGTWVTAVVIGGDMQALGRRGGLLNPMIVGDGDWINACGCFSSDDCSCSRICKAILPGPVGDVIEVKVSGAVVDPSAYRVDNGNQLVRTDGECWPSCQDMNAGPDEEGSFVVTYVQGFPIDDALNFAAGILAAEFLKACTGDKSCRLPAGVASLTRQGVQLDIVSRDPFESLLTGITEVDTVIAAYNPYGLRSAPVVISPDYRPTRQTTWSAP